MDVDRILEMLVPGRRAKLEEEYRAAVNAERRQQAEALAALESETRDQLRTLDLQCGKSRADLEKLIEAMRAAEEKVLALRRERQQVLGALDAARRTFEQAMRASAPADLLRSFVGRIDRLIEQAVPVTAFHTFYDGNRRQRHVEVAGDAQARRIALFRLKQQVQDGWHLEPLTDAEFEERFAKAIEAIPAMTAPPTVEEYLETYNRSVA